MQRARLSLAVLSAVALLISVPEISHGQASSIRRRAEEAAKSRGITNAPGAEISGKAKDFAKAHSIAAATPDVREDRIAELKKRIAAGEYKIDSEKVAEKMLSEHSL